MIGMLERWLGLANGLEIGAEPAEDVWRLLVAAYGGNGRFYHNLNHIQYMLTIADQLQSLATDFTAVQLAIWFHDIVYDPRRNDNEAQSAAYAEQTLRPLGVPSATLDSVSDLILATKNHETAISDPNYFVMLDADLAIFSTPAKQYDAYAQAIRQEYIFVPEAEFRKGRTAVLQRFLARSPFYLTAWMREKGDTAVAQNITRELNQLE